MFIMTVEFEVDLVLKTILNKHSGNYEFKKVLTIIGFIS